MDGDETGGREETGDVRMEADSGKEGACFSGVLGWNGGKPMSLVGEVISDVTVLEAGVTGVGVTGVGLDTGVVGKLRADGGVGLSISFFIQGWARHSRTLMRRSGSLTSSCLMKSMASGDMSPNSSSGKSRSPREICRKVSCSVSPPNGRNPVRST